MASSFPSRAPGPPSNAASMHPVSFSQWATAMASVKALYQKGQFKQCAARCNQLLEGGRAPTHPVHIAFLSFYAASCMDLTAKGLHPLSPTKLSLYGNARTLYLRAITACQKAETGIVALGDTLEKGRNNSVMRPSITWTAPAAHLDPLSSPSTVNSSTTSTPSSSPRNSPLHSPASSIDSLPGGSSAWYSLDAEGIVRPSPLRIRKTVRFIATLDSPPSTPTSPISPTSTQRRLLPLTPSSTQTTHKSPATDPILITRTFTRYATHLSSFTTQLHAHLARLDLAIEQTQQDQAARRVRFADLRDHNDDEVKALDRRGRIERLRAGGWRIGQGAWGGRERFEGGKYEELARKALGDLAVS